MLFSQTAQFVPLLSYERFLSMTDISIYQRCYYFSRFILKKQPSFSAEDICIKKERTAQRPFFLERKLWVKLHYITVTVTAFLIAFATSHVPFTFAATATL